MKTPVLIVTPDPKLGELISNSLAETFQYAPCCFREPQAAIDSLNTLRSCEHLLIETTLGEQAVLQVGRAARSLRRNIKLVLVSRTQPPASLDELRPWRLLRQPFLLPDLFGVLDDAETGFDLSGVPEKIVERLRQLAPAATIALTLGEKGSAVLAGGTIVRPSRLYSVSPVDRVGAGDAYAAGYLWAMLNGRAPQQAADAATALAALKCSIRGDVALVTRAELEELLASDSTEIRR